MRTLLALVFCALVGCAAHAQTVQPWVSGTATSTNTAAHTLIAAPGAPGAPDNTAIEITGIQCGRDDAGTTAIHVTFNDTNATVLVLPNNGGGGGNNAVFITPISPGVSTAFTFTSSNSTTTVTCNAQGFLR
jgi:hypothetical protein